MTVALLKMVNPMWEFLIGPLFFVGIGYAVRGIVDRATEKEEQLWVWPWPADGEEVDR